ncbi:MAG: glycosyltransferase [Parabacteroides sp.]|nr:glycosyltransferase [Parabacteroides sp.]
MKIIHVINSMSMASGGPARTTLLTLQGTRALGMEVEIVTNEPDPGEEVVSDDPAIRYLPRYRFQNKRWGYTKMLPQTLAEINGVDIYHIQGIWLCTGYVTARYARKVGRPYLVTLHGTLYPEALAHSSLKKKTTLYLYQRRQLQQAACIHVTCREEMEHYRALGFTNPVAIVPNPIEICEKENPSEEGRKKELDIWGVYIRLKELTVYWKFGNICRNLESC